MVRELQLHPIERDGTPRSLAGSLPEPASEVLDATVNLYTGAGYVEPWICYLAVVGDAVVGTCGFTAPPAGDRVEIAYFTFPGSEGRGIATAMARELLRIARRTDSSIEIAAQTLPQRNASHRVLEKLGFCHLETVDHPEDGEVWEWRLASRPGT